MLPDHLFLTQLLVITASPYTKGTNVGQGKEYTHNFIINFYLWQKSDLDRSMYQN